MLEQRSLRTGNIRSELVGMGHFRDGTCRVAGLRTCKIVHYIKSGLIGYGRFRVMAVERGHSSEEK